MGKLNIFFFLFCLATLSGCERATTNNTASLDEEVFLFSQEESDQSLEQSEGRIKAPRPKVVHLPSKNR